MDFVGEHILQEINISHLGKRKIIFKYALSGGYVNPLEGNRLKCFMYTIYYRFVCALCEFMFVQLGIEDKGRSIFWTAPGTSGGRPIH